MRQIKSTTLVDNGTLVPMNILATFNDNEIEPIGYADRVTVKAVIVNDKDEVLLFGGHLPGGGVEDDETNEQALARECMEEIGATVKIVHELGNVITYRDFIQKKYIFTGYQCRLISLVAPTTVFENEMGKPVTWKNRLDLILEMEQYVIKVREHGKDMFPDGDRYQRHLLNTKAALVFLKAIKK